MIRTLVTCGSAANGRRIAAARREAIARAVSEGAAELREAARRALAESGAEGPSAPSRPPRARSGRLRDSVFARDVPGALAAEVGTDLAYGRYLELGTRRTAARPWLRPAFAMTRSRLKARILAALRGRT